ncbi:uncharacterized protein BX663DRAFT_584322 [Cokeromyces recurvatus]|uniref:uncharacterized protein n=2 Tax=Cokeromyces recurvatus TaxID=90255 RepID=UPI002220B914|nr:uncharacterized protein BX663DRAFT_584322 [Cokeromyces recurvatus]KAI7897714.1 hypothetical protein BX663DRAFT_584322 [Cokeromyces recurvatus]
MLQEEGSSVPKAAAVCDIPRSSAYRLLDEFNTGDGHVLVGTTVKPKTIKPKKLFQEHTEFLIALFDKNPSIVLEEAKSQLLSNFPEIDEAGFHSQMMRSRAWLRADEPVKVKVHNQKGVSISIIGCITAREILSFSKAEPLKKHKAPQLEKEYHPDERDSKKRKADTSNQKPKLLKKGITAYHIVKFMESIMDSAGPKSRKNIRRKPLEKGDELTLLPTLPKHVKLLLRRIVRVSVPNSTENTIRDDKTGASLTPDESRLKWIRIFSKVISVTQNKTNVMTIAFNVCQYLKKREVRQSYITIYNDQKLKFELEKENDQLFEIEILFVRKDKRN